MTIEVKYKVKTKDIKWVDAPVSTLEVSPFDGAKEVNMRFADLLQTKYSVGDEVRWTIAGTDEYHRIRWAGSKKHDIRSII